MYQWILSNPGLAHHLLGHRSYHDTQQGAGVARGAYLAAKGLYQGAAWLFGQGARPVRAIAESVRRRRRFEWQVAELARLNDRALKDIGIDRSEIESIAHAVAEPAVVCQGRGIDPDLNRPIERVYERRIDPPRSANDNPARRRLAKAG